VLLGAARAYQVILVLLGAAGVLSVDDTRQVFVL
ncbi:unnamed protein product, partial [Oikopleura dioica]